VQGGAALILSVITKIAAALLTLPPARIRAEYPAQRRLAIDRATTLAPGRFRR
jgi:hypothetical protein